ncbi:MAG TPA: hypothetical protein VKN99_13375 [Polyangia bacterium]|nr:hypothetical protein [Polyangia bacterium]
MAQNVQSECEMCGARVGELRRGRCWGCYLRWVEARPVGLGAACIVCGERRRDLLRLAELLGRSQPMCHGCASRAARLLPMPRTLEGIRDRLDRERRRAERRVGKRDHRIFARERRVGERRASVREEAVWIDDEYVVEIIEPANSQVSPELEPEASELTAIRPLPDAAAK